MLAFRVVALALARDTEVLHARVAVASLACATGEGRDADLLAGASPGARYGIIGSDEVVCDVVLPALGALLSAAPESAGLHDVCSAAVGDLDLDPLRARHAGRVGRARAAVGREARGEPRGVAHRRLRAVRGDAVEHALEAGDVRDP